MRTEIHTHGSDIHVHPSLLPSILTFITFSSHPPPFSLWTSKVKPFTDLILVTSCLTCITLTCSCMMERNTGQLWAIVLHQWRDYWGLVNPFQSCYTLSFSLWIGYVINFHGRKNQTIMWMNFTLCICASGSCFCFINVGYRGKNFFYVGWAKNANLIIEAWLWLLIWMHRWYWISSHTTPLQRSRSQL